MKENLICTITITVYWCCALIPLEVQYNIYTVILEVIHKQLLFLKHLKGI